MGDKALPVAAHFSSRYNDLVTDMTNMGYSLVGYLPLVPVDDIVKAYEKEDARRKKGGDTAGKKGETTDAADGDKSSSDSE